MPYLYAPPVATPNLPFLKVEAQHWTVACGDHLLSHIYQLEASLGAAYAAELRWQDRLIGHRLHHKTWEEALLGSMRTAVIHGCLRIPRLFRRRSVHPVIANRALIIEQSGVGMHMVMRANRIFDKTTPASQARWCGEAGDDFTSFPEVSDNPGEALLLCIKYFRETERFVTQPR